MPLVPQRGRHGVWEAEHGLRLGWDPGILAPGLLPALGQTGSIYSWPKRGRPQA